jgi:hypothetical protein
MNGRKIALVIAAATMTGALGMSGCVPDRSPGTPPAATPSGGSPPGGSTQTARQSTDLLKLNDTLKSKLGSAYADSWIEGGRLHVAVTTKEAKEVVSRTGAVPKLVAFDAVQLAAAVRAVAAWQASLPPEQAASIHRIISDGRTGTVTIYVAAAHMDTISAAAAKAAPAGKVPLAVKLSPGLATPFQAGPSSGHQPPGPPHRQGAQMSLG